MKSIAVLLACYNRKEKTLKCLESLFLQKTGEDLAFDVFLLDDGSTDGTAEAVELKYPDVMVTRGSGSLFWAGGMRKIWTVAKEKQEYDFYLLLNDDIDLFPGSLQKIMNAYQLTKEPGNILTGSMQDPVNSKISYGGSKLISNANPKSKMVVPDSTQLMACDLANANMLLVDKATVDTIGIFSTAFTHAIADYDYSLKAVKAGIKVWVAPGIYGYCEDDHGNSWLPQRATLKERIQFLHSPKGLAYEEYGGFIKEHFPGHYTQAKFKLWLKTFFPVLWNQFKESK